jgi:hypothetical protein
MLVVLIHPEQWNGGSDRCTIALLRHFVQAGHQVVWLTTMIDDYWAGEEFHGVGKCIFFTILETRNNKIVTSIGRMIIYD